MILRVPLSVLALSFAASACTTNSTVKQVQAVICSPAAGSTTTTFHFSAADSSPKGVHVAQVYVDGVKHGDYYTADVETNITLPAGTHRLTLQVIDKSGAYAKKTEYVNVQPVVDLAWAASTSTGVYQYNVYRSLVSGTGFVRVGIADTTAYKDDPGVGKFYYVVTAVSPKGESKYSNQIAVTLK
jgi:hypothetical protein